MGAEQSTLYGGHGAGGPGEIKYYIMRVTIDRSIFGGGSADSAAEPGAMCVFGLGGQDEPGQLFALSKAGPNRWVMDGKIEFPAGVNELVCVIQSSSGDDIGFVSLVHSLVDSTRLGGQGLSKLIECPDSMQSMWISWHQVQLNSQAITVLNISYLILSPIRLD